MAKQPSNLVGIQEIADMAEVTRQVVVNWRARHVDFPKPVADLSSGSVFKENEVRRWLRRAKPEHHVAHALSVDAAHLVGWADRYDARVQLPRLIRKLVDATSKSVSNDFPAGEAIDYSGWDGVVELHEDHPIIPPGTSGWELSTEKDRKQKADGDYEKRKRDPGDLDPRTTTFVFVTPRRWPKGKKLWAATKRRERFWADVRAYDADDLEQWIEQAPGVHAWFGQLIGVCPPGVRSPEHVWQDWSARTDPPLSMKLMSAGRGDVVRGIQDCIRALPSQFVAQADTREEVTAFFAGALLSLSEQDVARTVVVDHADLWPQFVASTRPLILVPTFGDVAAVRSAVEHGHHVLLPLSLDAIPPRGFVRLPKLDRDAVTKSLEDMGLRPDHAERLAREGAGRVEVLVRRLGPVIGVPPPMWAEGEMARALAPLRLAGGWDDSFPADREIVARLAHRERYEEVENTLKVCERQPNSPLRRVGSVWQWASPEDSWCLLAPSLVESDISVFREVTREVLGIVDPRYDLPVDERYLAAVKGKVASHSPTLRSGLAETTALLATRGELDGPLPGQQWADLIVHDLLGSAKDWRAWASLSHSLPTLAEAAPDAFLDALRDNVIANEIVIQSIFAEEMPWGHSSHTGLLWALETLAWSPRYLSEVTIVLGELAARDPGGQLANRPGASLRQIFLGWYPQTTAPLHTRMQATDVLAQKQPDVAWHLGLNLLAEGHAFSVPTPRPRWREWVVEWTDKPSDTDFWPTVHAAGERLLKWVGQDARRWTELVPRLNTLLPEHRDAAVEQLSRLPVSELFESDRIMIREAIRTLLHHHRSFPETNWALPAPVLDRLDAVYQSLEPQDPVQRVAWLFSLSAGLPNPPLGGWEAHDRARDIVRVDAVRSVYSVGGADAVIKLAKTDQAQLYALAVATVKAELDPEAVYDMLDRSLDSSEPALREFGIGLASSSFALAGWEWVDDALARPIGKAWNEEKRVDFACGLPFEGKTWDLVASWGKSAEQRYWQRIGAGWVKDVADLARALESLLAANRPYAAFHVAAYSVRGGTVPSVISTDLLARVLEHAAQSDPEREAAYAGDSVEYHVQELLRAIENAEDLDEQRLIRLEWLWLPALRWGEGRPKALQDALARDPTFFAQVLSVVYKPEDGAEEGFELLTDEAKARAHRAWDLLRTWATLPGRGTDGTLDREVLRTWVAAARDACRNARRGRIGDHQIGELLAHAPPASDGVWPHEAIREIVEDVDSRDLERGLLIGILNRRGVFTKDLGEGGVQERELATKYRSWAAELQDRWTRTAAVLRKVADTYEADARREDIEAELL